VGTPLVIDNATSKRLYGHYARILVGMDLSKKMFYEILVEREGFSFAVEVIYELVSDLVLRYFIFRCIVKATASSAARVRRLNTQL
jgi:hypothetical protein